MLTALLHVTEQLPGSTSSAVDVDYMASFSIHMLVAVASKPLYLHSVTTVAILTFAVQPL